MPRHATWPHLLARLKYESGDLDGMLVGKLDPGVPLRGIVVLAVHQDGFALFGKACDDRCSAEATGFDADDSQMRTEVTQLIPTTHFA